MDTPIDAIVVPDQPPPAPPTNTGAFGTIGAWSILLALLGLLSMCFVGSYLMANMNATAPIAPAADATAMDRFQYEMANETLGVSQRYFAGHAFFMAWHVVVVGLLIIGGILVMRRTQSGRKFMLYVLLMVLLFEGLRTLMLLAMMFEIVPIMDEALHRVMKRVGTDSEQMVYLKRMSQGATVLMVIAGLLWPAAKLFIYGWMARYLASREAIDACKS